ncbi:hypothetical protein [Actinopolymorpha pittospori]|uniref:Uncharacterized protein n=1 Tax=Actinopolymorpha pittospori TaxID=648752 RepID=A0A927MMB7_9ACTN|nr:hypothetical protein [Actinopolymorpha pittospori]MBE1603306.1 hypothetical protein [Actinopolymorpha pittospori]
MHPVEPGRDLAERLGSYGGPPLGQLGRQRRPLRSVSSPRRYDPHLDVDFSLLNNSGPGPAPPTTDLAQDAAAQLALACTLHAVNEISKGGRAGCRGKVEERWASA